MSLKKFKINFEKEYEKEISPNHNLFINIKKKNIENIIEYPIESQLFTYNKSPISIKVEDEALFGQVKKNNVKQLYLSYLDLEKGFFDAPEKGFLNANEHSESILYLDIEKATTSDLELVPFIIHYTDGTKSRLTRITKRNQLLELEENEEKLRLTFKIKGSGSFSIKNIKIIKMKLGDSKYEA